MGKESNEAWVEKTRKVAIDIFEMGSRLFLVNCALQPQLRRAFRIVAVQVHAPVLPAISALCIECDDNRSCTTRQYWFYWITCAGAITTGLSPGYQQRLVAR